MTEPRDTKRDFGGRYHGATGARAARRRTRHGLEAPKVKVKVRSWTTVDKRSAGAQALLAWRAELYRDLGGEDRCSAQEKGIVELVVRARLYLDAVDAWLTEQPSMVIARRKSLLPVLRERTALSDSLSRYLQALGLERRATPLPTLTSYLTPAQAEAPPQPAEPREPAEPGP